MDFDSLEICIYNRLKWINSQIRVARKKSDTETMERFKGYRKITDRLLSETKQAKLKNPHDGEMFLRLTELYRSQSLI